MPQPRLVGAARHRMRMSETPRAKRRLPVRVLAQTMLHVSETALASLAGVLAYFIAVDDPAFPLTSGQRGYVGGLFLALLLVAALASLVKRDVEGTAEAPTPVVAQPAQDRGDIPCGCPRSGVGARGSYVAGAVLLASFVAWRLGSRP